MQTNSHCLLPSSRPPPTPRSCRHMRWAATLQQRGMAATHAVRPVETSGQRRVCPQPQRQGQGQGPGAPRPEEGQAASSGSPGASFSGGHRQRGPPVCAFAMAAAGSSRSSARPRSAAAAAGSSGSTECQFGCRPMRGEDLAAAARLHRFAKLQGKPVFGSDMSGVDEMLRHAAAGSSDAVGIVACSTSDPSDLMGCVTAQLEDSTQPPDGTAAAGGSAPRPSQMVLLTLVVRADQRQRGLGRVLLKALQDQAQSAGLGSIATDVAASNQPAVRFFESAGFKRTRARGKMLELALSLG